MDLSEQKFIAIEGDKKAGGGGAKEAPNTLQSSAIVKVVEVVSEGEIVGICGGAEGIYVNDTPLLNQDDTFNFQRVGWDIRVGLPDQDYMKGFPAVEAETIVNAPVTQDTPVARTVTSADIDAVRITVQLPQGLQKQNKKNGNLDGTEVEYAFDRKLTSSGIWTQVGANHVLKGKTTSPYEVQYRIDRPAGTGSWDYRMRRLTDDSDEVSLRNDTSISRVTEIQDIKLPYNDTAYVGISIDAESVGGTIPRRSYLVKGIICQVPVNYDPVLRTYTGQWNGTFKNAWTDNPAWVLYDLITNERYGCGQFITAANVDKFSFYDAGVYSDELVSDGAGGQEPRFTFNAVINARDEARRILQMIAGSMRATLVEINGIITVLQDRPASIAQLITKADVINGKFTYKSTPLNERHTAFNVSFNDRTDRHLQRITTVEDEDGIDRYGYVETDIAAYGATTEGQAIRHGKWALDTELNQTELASWKMSFSGFALMPYDIVSVWDENYTGSNGGGLIVSATTNTVTLDRPVAVITGTTITVTLADGTLETKNVTNVNGTHTTLTVNSAFSDDLMEQGTYIVKAAASPRQFRVMNIKQEEPNIVSVEAVFHDPNKYSRVETGIDIPAPVYSNVTPTTTSAPTSLLFREVAVNENNVQRRSLIVSWQPPSQGIALNYVVKYRVNNGEYRTVNQVNGQLYEIRNAIVGEYDVVVYARSAKGFLSAPVVGSYEIEGAATGASTLLAPILLGEQSDGSAAFTGPDLHVEWTNPTAQEDVETDTLLDFEVRVIETAGSTILRTEYVPAVEAGQTQEYSYTYSKNLQDGGPRRAIRIEVRCRDMKRRLSDEVARTFTNPAPAALTSISTISGIGSIKITWGMPQDTDFAGVLVWRSTTSGFTPAESNFLSYVQGNYYSDTGVSFGTTYYYRLAPYDTFGKTLDGAGLNISAQQTVAALEPPGIPEVDGLPSPTGYTGPGIVYNSQDGQLYSYVDGAWEPTIPPVSDLADGSVTMAKFAPGIRPPEVFNTLPNTGNVEGRQVYLTSDKKLYRYDGTAWISTVAAADISGQVADAQIAAVAASKLTGTVVASQIADAAINAAKLASTIKAVETVSALPLSGNVEGRVVYLTTDDKLYRYTGSAWTAAVPAVDITGQLSDSQLAAISAAKLTGQITSTQITDNAVTTAKINAGAVSTNSLAAGAVTTAKIAAGAITAAEIAAGAITTAKLAAGAVTATEIASNAITVGKIAAGAVRASEMALGVVSENLFYNGSPDVDDLDVAGWYQINTSGAGGTFTRVATTIAGMGTKRFNIAKASTADGTAWASRPFAVVPGNTYSIKFRAAADVGSASGRYFRVFYGSALNANGQLTSADSANDLVTANSAWSAPVVDYGAYTWVAPTGAKFASFAIYSWTSGPAALWIDNFEIYCTTGATLMRPGMIYSDALVANSITSAQIKAGTITATEIAAATITGAKIAAGTITGSNLVAGTITATQIATSAITADKLAADSVVAGKIAAGAIGADEIAARAITVQKLAVTDFTNLVPNGSFDLGTSGAWSTFPANWSVVKNTASSNTVFVNAPTTWFGAAGVGSAGAGPYAMPDWLSCKAGDQFYVSMQAATTGTYSTNTFRYIVYWLYADETTGSNSFYFPSLTTTWTTEANPVTAPAGAVGMRVRVFHDTGSASTGTIYFTNVSARRMANSELIVDGAVLANKLAANSVIAGKIAASAVTAATIAAGAVTTTALAADAVTADKIAAGTITATEIAASTITGAKIASGTLTATHIAAGAITASELAANAVTTTALAANAVTAAKMAVGTITAASGIIANAAIDTANIIDLNVTTAKIAGQAVTLPVSTYSTSIQSISSSDVTVATVSITSTGAPIVIQAGLEVNCTYTTTTVGVAPATLTVSLYRGTTMIAAFSEGGFTQVSDSGTYTYTMRGTKSHVPLRDTPGIGTYTYTLRVRRGSGGATTYQKESAGIVLLETKK